jgi:alpha-N-arabinofuranosidase
MLEPKYFLLISLSSSILPPVQRIELAWLGTESNQFGTDEFIDYARALGVEPYLCLNSTYLHGRVDGDVRRLPTYRTVGTGTYEEALAWLEYCNGTGDTQ